MIHSKDESVIEQFALKKPVGRILVNTSAVYGSMGMTTNLFPAMTLGSGTVGQGITSDNVSPMNLIYKRKVGYGIRHIEDLGMGMPTISTVQAKDTARQVGLERLQKLLEEALRQVQQS